MFYVDRNKQLSEEDILKYITKFKSYILPRLQQLKRYYDCKNDKIMSREFKDTTKPNNKIATPWSKYISDLTTAYFIGKGVSYNSVDVELLQTLNMLSDYNDESAKNQQLAINESIYGIAYELIYLYGPNAQIRYSVLDSETVIPIYSDDIEEDLIYAIRFYDVTDITTDITTTKVVLYSETEITDYEINNSVIKKVDEGKKHYLGEVPVNVYKNNPDCIGDSENLLALIDGYDFSLSDTANSRQELMNSYLVFKNCNLDDPDIIAMKQKRVINIEDVETGQQASVDFLDRNTNDAELENYTTRLEKSIKMFSGIGDLESKSHQTATSAEMSMMGLTQNIAIKENYFRYALLRRIEIICNALNKKGKNFNFSTVKITFTRNLPVDTGVVADVISKLRGVVSTETLIQQLPFVTDVSAEMKKLEQEKEVNSYADMLQSGDVNGTE
ncbi:MAG: phage portal protein [Cellulosilyticum sp.]|nr:phage portal protein [Cellulosilyticum sp.]